MDKINVVEISAGIDFINMPVDRFKTAEISVSMAVPLEKESAGGYALTAYLLSRSCEQYPDFMCLNRKLASLYGASISVSVTKIGESQVLKLGVTAIDDRFALDDAKISKKCVELLLDMLFTPNLKDGFFPKSDIEREKRLLTERLLSEQNDKRAYALRRLEEEMFASEPYSINALGDVKSIEKLTPADITDYWVKLITTSKILVTVVGNIDNELITGKIQNTFLDIYRQYKGIKKCAVKAPPIKVNTVTEKQHISQGKLVLGFRVDMPQDDPECQAMSTAVDIFGGGPYSRLFANVREKMSLCYYCSARYIRAKSAVIVQCGCEEENMDKAVEEILKQLDTVAQGVFTHEDFNASKSSMRDSLLSFNDNPAVLEASYVMQMCYDEYLTPGQRVSLEEKVEESSIGPCAAKIRLDTVFKLVGENIGEAQR